MKYRRLTKEELAPLNEEFLKYLLVANVTPSQWENLKLNNPEACEKHIEVFSDLVFEKILTDIQFVTRILPKRLEIYQFLKDYAWMYAVEPKLMDTFAFDESKLHSINLNDFEIIEGKKRYKLDKAKEVFEIIEDPQSKISDGSIFKEVALKVARLKE